ncbi:histidine phosphatase superfamily [Nemania serpens]|nr:histidine phosphatase superfamily [Nemania serpens]
MAPTIHILRHAHAAHQSNYDPSIHDPELSALGIRQCQALAADIAKLGKIDLILSSPMKRAIQTALVAFPAYTQSQSKIVLLSDLQECGTGNSDVGSSLADLVRQFGSAHLDYSFVYPAWTNKGPGTRYDPQFVTARARATRLFIRAIAQRFRATDAHIVVISHLMYIGHLTRGDYIAHDNAELRSFRFEQIVGGDGEAGLCELPCSITRKLAIHYQPQAESESVSDAQIPVSESGQPEKERPIGCSPDDAHEVYCPMYGAQAPTSHGTRQSGPQTPVSTALLGAQGGATGNTGAGLSGERPIEDSLYGSPPPPYDSIYDQ